MSSQTELEPATLALVKSRQSQSDIAQQGTRRSQECLCRQRGQMHDWPVPRKLDADNRLIKGSTENNCTPTSFVGLSQNLRGLSEWYAQLFARVSGIAVPPSLLTNSEKRGWLEGPYDTVKVNTTLEDLAETARQFIYRVDVKNVSARMQQLANGRGGDDPDFADEDAFIHAIRVAATLLHDLGQFKSKKALFACLGTMMQEEYDKKADELKAEEEGREYVGFGVCSDGTLDWKQDQLRVMMTSIRWAACELNSLENSVLRHIDNMILRMYSRPSFAFAHWAPERRSICQKAQLDRSGTNDLIQIPHSEIGTEEVFRNDQLTVESPLIINHFRCCTLVTLIYNRLCELGAKQAEGTGSGGEVRIGLSWLGSLTELFSHAKELASIAVVYRTPNTRGTDNSLCEGVTEVPFEASRDAYVQYVNIVRYWVTQVVEHLPLLENSEEADAYLLYAAGFGGVQGERSGKGAVFRSGDREYSYSEARQNLERALELSRSSLNAIQPFISEGEGYINVMSALFRSCFGVHPFSHSAI